MRYIAILLMLPLLNGCAVGMIAAGVGAVKAANAKKREAATNEKAKYGEYRVEMERLNLEREKAALTPTPIMTFEEWNSKK